MNADDIAILISKIESNRRMLEPKAISELRSVEYKVFSQFADDGIIDYLVGHLAPNFHSFIEFGVEDYRESNTRLLLFRDNWRGLVIDGSESRTQYIQGETWFWRFDLSVECAFVTAENINEIFKKNDFVGDLGLLSIDIDGNDYWIWEAIDIVRPAIVICEYNSLFGADLPVSIPYDSGFDRLEAHPSGLYAGCSLAALDGAGKKKGYFLAGTNSAGNNAYFLRSDLDWPVGPKTVKEGYTASRFREARDFSGDLIFKTVFEVADGLIGDLPLVNVVTGEMYKVRDVITKKEAKR